MAKGTSPRDLWYRFIKSISFNGGGEAFGEPNDAQGTGITTGSTGISPVEVSGMGMVKFTFEVNIPTLTAGAGVTYYNILTWAGRMSSQYPVSHQGNGLCIYDILVNGGIHPSTANTVYASDSTRPTQTGGSGTLTLEFGFQNADTTRETIMSVSGDPDIIFDRVSPITKLTSGGGLTTSNNLPRQLLPDISGGEVAPRTFWLGVSATTANINAGVFKVAVLALEF